jgi:NADPH2:quinone reductase
VLITAAGGGVGSLLIQLAKNLGAAPVTAAASNVAKREAALRAGADAAIGYDEIADAAPDLIYESVGGDVLPRCLDALAPKGIIVTYGALNLQSFALGVPELKRIVFGNQTLRGFAFGPLVDLATLKDDLRELFDLHKAGRIRVSVSRLKLAQAATAHTMLADRSSTGKLALIVTDSMSGETPGLSGADR